MFDVDLALDRSRKIKNFGDAGGHEYCLCERPDACPPTGDTAPGTFHGNVSAVAVVDAQVVALLVGLVCLVDTAAPAAVAKPSAAAAKAPLTNDKAFLKIFMCGLLLFASLLGKFAFAHVVYLWDV